MMLVRRAQVSVKHCFTATPPASLRRAVGPGARSSWQVAGLVIRRRTAAPQRLQRHCPHAEAGGDGPSANKEFGYSRKDVLLICGGLGAFGCALYYGLQAMGMEAGYAGNWVQFLIFVGICVGWTGSYVWRVATKQMTYVKQLENYEQAVMQKRMDELTEPEVAQLVSEVEQDRAKRAARQAAGDAENSG